LEKILGSSGKKLLSGMFQFSPAKLLLTAQDVSSGRKRKTFDAPLFTGLLLWSGMAGGVSCRWLRVLWEALCSYLYPACNHREETGIQLDESKTLGLELSYPCLSDTVINSSCCTDKVHLG